MKRNILHWVSFLLISIGITIFGQFIFKEYRLSHLLNLDGIGIAEFLFTVIFLPISLVVVKSFLDKRFRFISSFTISLFLAIICISLSSWLDFNNWWNTKGKILDNTDAEARDVVEIGLFLQYLLAVVSTIVNFYAFRTRNRHGSHVDLS